LKIIEGRNSSIICPILVTGRQRLRVKRFVGPLFQRTEEDHIFVDFFLSYILYIVLVILFYMIRNK